MRAVVVLLALPIAACGASAHYSDGRLMSRINKQYEVRDACLATNAAPYISSDSNATSIGQTVSLSCQAETDKLISLSNPTNDPNITAAIQRDSAFRATGIVLKARGQGTTN